MKNPGQKKLRQHDPVFVGIMKNKVEDYHSYDLKQGHVIHTLMSEHNFILDYLDELENHIIFVEKMHNYSKDRYEVKELAEIIKRLESIESHIERENKVLFPELKTRGFFGPVMVMEMEHENLNENIENIKQLITDTNKIDFETFKWKLNLDAKCIVISMRDHIHQENNILYPAALEIIRDNKTWNRLKSECDRIGYFHFFPSTWL